MAMTRVQFRVLQLLVHAFISLNRGIRAHADKVNELAEAMRDAEREQDEPNR